MKYRRQNYSSRYNNYTMAGGYDSTGRWRSEAWHMDGGANDEGWHQAHCHLCGKETEHGRGSGCVPCGDRAVRQRLRKSQKNPAQADRRWMFSLYEKKAGNLPNFLQSLKEQNELRCLSTKQIETGMKILSKHIDVGTLRSFWIAAHRK